MTEAWFGSTRRDRLPADWHRRRAATYRAAHGTCSSCSTFAPLHRQPDGTPAGQADHIDRTLGDEQANLQWLCARCHRDKSSAEGHEAAAAMRAKGKHPREVHPALGQRLS